MRLLLDTHIFLWYISAETRLSATHRAAIENRANDVFLSAASVWEVVIKHGLGKLPLPESPAAYLPKQRDLHGIMPLPIDEGAMEHLAALPQIHRDPFDRILVAQTLQHGLALVAVDEAILRYGVPSLAGRA
jgi:PIN domain nuclease of toxin-antitoxin system